MLSKVQHLGNKVTEISNQFSEGDFCDFRVATEKIIEAYRLEIQICKEEDLDETFWQEETQKAESALKIYNDCCRLAELQAVERLSEAGLEEYAEALESGNYEGFAF
jgi:hypothetical protein